MKKHLHGALPCDNCMLIERKIPPNKTVILKRHVTKDHLKKLK